MPELETLDSCLVQRTSPLKYRKKVRAFNPRSGQPQFRIDEETKRRYELEVNFNKADVRKQFIKFWHEHYPLETFLYHNKDFNEIAEFRIVSDLEEAGSGSRSGIFKFVIEEVNLMPDDFVAPSTPENLLIDNISLSGFDASWDAATDNVGVAGYRVVISGGIYSNHEIDVGNDTSPAVAVVLENGKIYVASVIAYDDAGNPSDPSSAVEFDTTMRLLDVMGHKDNGFAVFGLRKLRAAYSGMCFRLKRDSDDDETDIGFDSNGAYDLAAFNSFVDGETSSLALELLAEGGDNTDVLGEAVAADEHLASLSSEGPIAPSSIGSPVVLTVPEDQLEDMRLTVISMLVHTNDAFTGANGTNVSSMAVGDTIRLTGPTWDAGTENNDEQGASMPGPDFGGEGFNSNRDDIIDRVRFHQGAVTAASVESGDANSDLAERHRFDNPTSRISITRTE